MGEVRISAERHGNRIHIKPLTFLGQKTWPIYLARVKAIPGTTYSAKLKCQTSPLDMQVCRDLREAFGRALEVGPELLAWAKEEVEREKQVLEVHQMDMTKPVRLERVPVLAPTAWAAMQNRAFQTVPAKFGALVGSYMNADEPGLGKTIETFGSIIEAGITGDVLIVAPSSSLRTTWEYEIHKWLEDIPGGPGVWVADESTANRRKVLKEFAEKDTRHSLNFLVVNAEMCRLREHHSCPIAEYGNKEVRLPKTMGGGYGLGSTQVAGCDGTDPYCDAADDHHTFREGNYPELFDTKWNAQIGDEIHKYMRNANPRAGKRVSQVGLGIQRLPLAPGGVRIPLTGTPMRGRPELVWPILHWLRPDYYTSEGRFKKQFFVSVPDAYAYSGEKFIDVVREDREEAFHHEINRLVVRRTKEELRAINPAWAPPPKLYHHVPIYLGKKQMAQYRDVERRAELKSEGRLMLINGTLAVRTRLKQLAGCSGRLVDNPNSGDYDFVPVLPSAKFDWLVDSLLQSLGITGDPKTEQGEGKVVVASQFTQFINLWAAELRRIGIGCHVLTGESKPQERLRAQQEFQKWDPTKPRVFLLNTHAGGTSLTLDAADDLVVMDSTENPDDQTQVVDRVHRTSRVDHQVNIWMPLAMGTIDEEMMESNERKDNNQKAHLDGRRGVAFAKQIATGNEAEALA